MKKCPIKRGKIKLQWLEQTVNHANINSCEAAQQLVGGLWPKTLASQKSLCQSEGVMGASGRFSDYQAARGQCQKASALHDTLQEAEANPKTKEAVVLNHNIVWSLLKRSSIVSDTALAELVMSLTGTLIIDGHGKVTSVPSLAEDAHLIQALLGNDATKAQHWACMDTERCLTVHLTPLALSPTQSFRGKVAHLLQGLYQHLREDTEPTSAQKQLAQSYLPVVRLMAVLAAGSEVETAYLDDYAGLVAQELLVGYLNELLSELNRLAADSSLAQALSARLTHQISEAKAKVLAMSPTTHRRLTNKLQLIEQIRRLEKSQGMLGAIA